MQYPLNYGKIYSGPAGALRALFFSTLPSFFLREIVFFRTFPTKPTKVLGLLYTTGWVYYNPNTIKSYKNYLQNTQHMVLRNRPTLSIGTERLACLNSAPGVQPRTLAYSTRQVPGSSPGPGWRVARAFDLHPPFLSPSPPNPRKMIIEILKQIM